MKRQSFDARFKAEALQFAKDNSGEATARKFGVSPSTIRDWKKQAAEIEQAVLSNNGKRKRLAGAGCKKASEELEAELLDWVHDQRSKHQRVSRKMIQFKARELFPQVDDKTVEVFKASRGWLEKFMDRNELSNRRKSLPAQKDPHNLAEHVASYVALVSKIRQADKIADNMIVAMDETPVWFDLTGEVTVEANGSKSVLLQTTRRETNHMTVALAAKGDGTKLKPYIIFKGGVEEVERLQCVPGVRVVSSKNGWMNEELTMDWLNNCYGRLAFEKRILAWDSYRHHISQNVKRHFRLFNSRMVVIPGGCTKYIQAPEVYWNKPFKNRLTTLYSEWMAGDIIKEYAKGGTNLKAPSMESIVQWVKTAWESLDSELIKTSFKCCALTTAVDGSEDNQVACMSEGNSCRGAWDILLRYRGVTQVPEMVDTEDFQQAEENEILIDSSEDEID